MGFYFMTWKDQYLTATFTAWLDFPPLSQVRYFSRTAVGNRTFFFAYYNIFRALDKVKFLQFIFNHKVVQ